MKNIFKLMGVALMACTLIVACSKDKEEEGGTTIPEGISVSFNGYNWSSSVNECAYYSQYGVLQFSASEVEGSYPFFDETLRTTEVGNYNEDATTEMHQFASTSKHNYVEYYEETSLVDNNENYYGDWWASQATTNIKAIDLTALTVSAELNGTMFSALEAWVNNAGFDGAPKAPYSATFGKVALTAK